MADCDAGCANGDWSLRPCSSFRQSLFAMRPGLRPHLRPRVGLEHLPQPVAEFAAIIFAHGIVADGRRDLGDPRLERRAPLGRIEPAGLGLAHPQHVGERARGADDLGDRLAAARAHEIIGIVPFGQAGELQALAGLDQRQGQIDGAIGGAPPGGIAVEAERRLVRHLPEQNELVGGERGAERRHRRLEAGSHHGDHVDIALDRDHRRALVRGGARGGDVVERPALVEERRLRRVQVFRLRVLLERASAEGDDAAAQIGDRKHHAIAEAVVGHRDVVAGNQQPGFDHVRRSISLPCRDAP